MLTAEVEQAKNWPMAEPDRVARARKQEALLRELDRAEQRAVRKAEASERLRYEAAQIRREALVAAKSAGISAQELADKLGVSVQRVYQLLADVVSPDEPDPPGIGADL